MRGLMTRPISTCAAVLRFAAMLLVLIFATFAVASRPLPPQVLSKAPEIHPFGKGRHTWLGIRMYDATLWIFGPPWAPPRTSSARYRAGPSCSCRHVSQECNRRDALSEGWRRAPASNLGGGTEADHSERSPRRSDRHLLPG